MFIRFSATSTANYLLNDRVLWADLRIRSSSCGAFSVIGRFGASCSLCSTRALLWRPRNYFCCSRAKLAQVGRNSIVYILLLSCALALRPGLGILRLFGGTLTDKFSCHLLRRHVASRAGAEPSCSPRTRFIWRI